MKTIDYLAGIGETNGVQIRARTVGGLIKKLKKTAKIDLRSLHRREVIFSEFRPGAWGVFFWRKENGSLDAWIEFNQLNPQGE